MSSHSHGANHHAELGHIVPDKTFHTVLGTLLFLTVVTVLVAGIDFGTMNLVIAMLVASIKASLVIFFFMHGAYENKIIWTYIVLPFILLAIMIGGVFTDNPYRATPEPVKAERTK